MHIDISTVKQILQISATTGDKCKRVYPSERAYRKINEGSATLHIAFDFSKAWFTFMKLSVNSAQCWALILLRVQCANFKTDRVYTP